MKTNAVEKGKPRHYISAMRASSKELSPCCHVKLEHYDRNLAYCTKCKKDWAWIDDDGKFIAIPRT